MSIMHQFVARNAHAITWTSWSATAALWAEGHAPLFFMAISTAATVYGVVSNVRANAAKRRMMDRWNAGKGFPPKPR